MIGEAAHRLVADHVTVDLALLESTGELTAGFEFESFRVLGWNERGVAVGLRRRGALAAGGGAFENQGLALVLGSGNPIAQYHLFDEPGAEQALARFAEMRGV